MSITERREKTMLDVFKTSEITLLQRTAYICYPVQFQEYLKIYTFITLSNRINAMTPTYEIRLDLPIQKTNVRASKIDRLTVVIYGIIIAWFLLMNKLERV